MKVSEVNEAVTAKVLEALDNGVLPWVQPWHSGLPTSLSTGKPYRGINNLVLGLTAMAKGYTSHYWGTFGQVAKLSGFTETPKKSGKGTWWAPPLDDPERRILKEDQNGTTIYFWKVTKRTNPDFPNDGDKDFVYLFATTYRVFNYEQCASLPEKYAGGLTGAHAEAIPEAQAVFDAYIERGPELRYGSMAYYEHSAKAGLDRITIPPLESYPEKFAGEYESTNFHEAAHSTGHKKRLNRAGFDEYTSRNPDTYATEELIAEMTSAMVCAYLGIDAPFKNSAAYLAGWARKIKSGDEKNMITTAARQAQKAFDYILGVTYENNGDE
jgi:antirestriction protein ArdC